MRITESTYIDYTDRSQRDQVYIDAQNLINASIARSRATSRALRTYNERKVNQWAIALHGGNSQVPSMKSVLARTESICDQVLRK